MWRLVADWKQKCRVKMGLVSIPNQSQHYDSKTGPWGDLKYIPAGGGGGRGVDSCKIPGKLSKSGQITMYIYGLEHSTECQSIRCRFSV